MESDTSNDFPDLIGALTQWCNQVLVEAVKQAERPHSMLALSQRTTPILGAQPPPSSASWKHMTDEDRSFRVLEVTWRRLEDDFRRQIEREELHLQGVEVRTTMVSVPRPINGALVSKFEFDYRRNSVRFKATEFVQIRLSRMAFPNAPYEVAQERSGREFNVDEIPMLNDDDILALLSAHADRVIASSAPRMLEPGTISLMPTIAGKMRWRAKHHELLPRVSEESRALAAWIKSALPLYPTPGANAIENFIRSEYRPLKAQSTPIT